MLACPWASWGQSLVPQTTLMSFGCDLQTESVGLDSHDLMGNGESPLQLQLALCNSCKKAPSWSKSANYAQYPRPALWSILRTPTPAILQYPNGHNPPSVTCKTSNLNFLNDIATSVRLNDSHDDYFYPFNQLQVDSAAMTNEWPSSAPDPGSPRISSGRKSLLICGPRKWDFTQWPMIDTPQTGLPHAPERNSNLMLLCFRFVLPLIPENF